MTAIHFRFVIFAALALMGNVSVLGQSNPNQSRRETIISPEQVAASFGYRGKLRIEDLTYLNTDDPNLIQHLTFTADNRTFLPIHITVTKGGTTLTPELRALFEEAAKSRSIVGDNSSEPRSVVLPDGTVAYLSGMGGPGGDGYDAMMTSKDGRFDLSVSVGVIAGEEYERNASNQDYYDSMLGDKGDILEKLAAAISQIYPIVVSNYQRIAERNGGSAPLSSPFQSPVKNGPSSQPLTPIASGSIAPNHRVAGQPHYTLWSWGLPAFITIVIATIIWLIWQTLRKK